MRYWLMKSEPDEVSIDDLARMEGQKVGWFGVRNYLARNYMRDLMQIGDLAFFYHSSCEVPGIAGIVEVCSQAYPDPTQFEPSSKYFDPKASEKKARWFQVDVRLVKKTSLLSLSQLRAEPGLEGLQILQRGNRLSITEVSEVHWKLIEGMVT